MLVAVKESAGDTFVQGMVLLAIRTFLILWYSVPNFYIILLHMGSWMSLSYSLICVMSNSKMTEALTNATVGAFMLDSTWFLSTRTLRILTYLFPVVPFEVWIICAAFIYLQRRLGVTNYGPRGQ
jgi:hypothetical protein